MAKSAADLHVAVNKLKGAVVDVQRSIRARVARPAVDLSDHVTAVEQATQALQEATAALDKSAEVS